MPVALKTYKPSDFLSSTGAPCMGCLSDTNKLSFILEALGTNLGLTNKQMVVASACLQNMSKRDMLTALTMILLNTYAPGQSAATAQSKTKCRNCIPEKHLLAAILYAYANISGF
jgi:hypothetical protein